MPEGGLTVRKHPARLAAAGISPARYDELRAVCRQYPEYRRQLERARAGIEDRPRRRGGAWKLPDPTGNAAIHLASLPFVRRLRAIEESAAAVAEPAIAEALIKNACEGIQYYRLRPAIGERQFYVLRQLFFIELDLRVDG